MKDALSRDIPQTSPDLPSWPERYRSDVDHARTTGANWGKHAVAELLAALRRNEPSKDIVAKMDAELSQLRSKIEAAHGLDLAAEWHAAALSTVEAGLPRPD